MGGKKTVDVKYCEEEGKEVAEGRGRAGKRDKERGCVCFWERDAT